MVNTRRAPNDLEKVGQVHSLQSLSESFQRCTYILNMNSMRIRGRAVVRRRPRDERQVQNDLEKVGQGHSLQNSSEKTE